MCAYEVRSCALGELHPLRDCIDGDGTAVGDDVVVYVSSVELGERGPGAAVNAPGVQH